MPPQFPKHFQQTECSAIFNIIQLPPSIPKKKKVKKKRGMKQKTTNESNKHFRPPQKTDQRNTFAKRQKRSNKQKRIKDPLSKNAQNEATVTKLRKLATPANYVVNSASLPI